MNAEGTAYRKGVKNGAPWAGVYADRYRLAARIVKDREVRAYLLGSARGCRAGITGGRPVCLPSRY